MTMKFEQAFCLSDTITGNRLDGPLATVSINDLKHCGAMPPDDPEDICITCVNKQGGEHQ